MLEREFDFFQKQLPEYIKTYAGKYVLIVGESLVGVFASEDEALIKGQEVASLGSFLVEKVGDSVPQPMRFNPWVGFVGAP